MIFRFLYSVLIWKKKEGIPAEANLLYEKMASADLLNISLAEYDGSYTAAFKNLFDWMTRHVTKCWENKPILLLSTSPGQRGGKGVIDAALIRFPIYGSVILERSSLPGFHENFSDKQGIMHKEAGIQYTEKIKIVKRYHGMENF